MNVWIISHYCGSSKHGMSYRHFYLAQELQKIGVNVQIIASSFSHLHAHPPKITGQLSYEVVDGIDFAWIKTNPYKCNGFKRILNMLNFTLKLFIFARRINFPKPDIVIASSPHPFLFFNGWHLKNVFKAKLISEVRDIWPLTILHLSKLTKFNPLIILMSLAEKIAYKKSHATVSLLPTALGHMSSKGLKESNFHYIPNGVKSDVSSLPLIEEIKARIPKDKFIVGYAGTFGDANALDYFIKAAQILQDSKDIHFILVGDGFCKDQLTELAVGLENLTFLGRVKKEEVNSILEYFNLCYIGLRKSELFAHGISPNKIFDYMNAKKPILMAIEAGNDIVTEAQCGITIKSEDENALANGINEIYNMTENERKSLGENGYKFLILNHTYSQIASRYASLFDALSGSEQ